MNTITINPPRWDKQDNEFYLQIQVHDESLNPKNFSVLYGMSHDGTSPQLTQTVVPVNYIASIFIYRPCTISFIVTVDGVNHEYLDKKITIPEMVSISGYYNGSPVEVSDLLDEKLLTIYGVYDNGRQKQIMAGYAIESGQICQREGSNTLIVTYEAYGQSFRCAIPYVGVTKLLSIDGEYFGPELLDGDFVYKTDFKISAKYLSQLEPERIYSITITENEWRFQTLPIADASNKGLLTIVYKNCQYEIQVPIKVNAYPYLDAYWDGGILDINEIYDVETVCAEMHYSRYVIRRVDSKKCQYSGDRTYKDGANEFGIAYMENNQTFKTKFYIYAEPDTIFQDKELSITHLNKDGKWEDVADFFKYEFKRPDGDGVTVSWNGFLKVCQVNNLTGKFKVTAPQRSGLINKYASDWLVLVDGNLKATPIKIHTELKEET